MTSPVATAVSRRLGGRFTTAQSAAAWNSAAHDTGVVLDCETPVDQTRASVVFREGGLPAPQAERVIGVLRQDNWHPIMEDIP